MRSTTSLLLLAWSVWPGPALAQERITIDDFSFLTGYWVGTGLGGVAEEIWMPPVDGRMFGIFKHSSDGKLNFSEYMEIAEEDGRWVLRLKHYGADFNGWEAQNEHISFPLESVSRGAALFEGLTYRQDDDGELEVAVTLHSSDGSSTVETLYYKKMALD